MPAPDWLEGLGGAFGGITRGLTQGMEPFSAYEKVRTADLANDKSDIALRDYLAQQTAREQLPDYYGNAAGAVDTGNRLATSKGNRDIYGIDQSLGASQYLGSEGFQQMVANLDPSDPEYRIKVAAALAQYDPQGGIAAYDKMNIPGMQQQNLNHQAVLQYVQAHAQTLDAGATAHLNPDGSISVVGSDGQESQMPPDIVMRAADMMGSKTPYDAVSKGVKDEVLIQKSNADMYKALTSGNITPAQQIKVINDNRVLWTGEMSKAQQGYEATKKSQEYQMEPDPAKKAEMLRPFQERGQAAQKQLQQIAALQQAVIGGQLPGRGGGGTPLPTVAPQGTSSVTARRLPPGGAAAMAAGVAPAGAAPGGRLPYREPGANNTGVQPIGTDAYGVGSGWGADVTQGGPGPMSPDALNAYVQSLLQGG